MANTYHDSTARLLSEQLSQPRRPDTDSSQDYCPLRFTSTRTGRQDGTLLVSSISTPLLACVSKAVESALASHTKTGGATVNLREGDLAGRKLFAVSIYPDRTIELKNPPSRQQLFAFVMANLDLLSIGNHALGTWFNGWKNVHVLDVVVCLFDCASAMHFGARFDQCSIFDLAAGVELLIRSPRTDDPTVEWEVMP
jgi:hypothetical protein